MYPTTNVFKPTLFHGAVLHPWGLYGVHWTIDWASIESRLSESNVFFLPFHHGPQTYIPHSRGQTCCRSREKQEVLQQVCISSNCSKGTLTVNHKSTRAKDKINAKRRIQYRKKIEEFQKVFAVFIIWIAHLLLTLGFWYTYLDPRGSQSPIHRRKVSTNGVMHDLRGYGTSKSIYHFCRKSQLPVFAQIQNGPSKYFDWTFGNCTHSQHQNKDRRLSCGLSKWQNCTHQLPTDSIFWE